MSRADISTQVRYRKEEELRKGVAKLKQADAPDAKNGDVKILTSCPSCLQGLSRFRHDMPLEADYIVVEIARTLLGAGWMAEYVNRANAGGIERVLL